MGSNIVTRSLERMRDIISGAASPRRILEAQDLDRLRAQMRDCADGTGGGVHRQFNDWAPHLSGNLDDDGRRTFLRMIALEFARPKRVADTHAALSGEGGHTRTVDAEPPTARRHALLPHPYPSRSSMPSPPG